MASSSRPSLLDNHGKAFVHADSIQPLLDRLKVCERIDRVLAQAQLRRTSSVASCPLKMMRVAHHFGLAFGALSKLLYTTFKSPFEFDAGRVSIDRWAALFVR